VSEIQPKVEALDLDATNPPGYIRNNGTGVLLFDDTTDELAAFKFQMPADYSSGLEAEFIFAMTSATSGNVIMAVEVMAVTPADSADLDTDSYDTVNTSAATAVRATAGYPTNLTITLTNADSVAADDWVKVRIRRDANNASDTATGDLELHTFRLNYTAA